MTLAVLICVFFGNSIGQEPVVESFDGEVEQVGEASMLLESAGAGDIEGIHDALDDGADIDTVNVNGWSAASFAVASGKLEALQVLIESRIDLNQANNEGMT